MGPVKIRVPKTCGSRKNLGPKRFLVPKNYWFQRIIKLGLVGRIGMGRQGSRHLLDTFQRHYKNIPDTFQTPSRHLKRHLLDNFKTPQLLPSPNYTPVGPFCKLKLGEGCCCCCCCCCDIEKQSQLQL